MSIWEPLATVSAKLCGSLDANEPVNSLLRTLFFPFHCEYKLEVLLFVVIRDQGEEHMKLPWYFGHNYW